MSTTLIARRTRVVGHIETHGDVVVEGRIEGSIVAAGCVTIGVAGVAVSEIHAGRAVVLGIVIGNIEATERIDVAASARIVGDVRSPTVSMANPAAVEGRIEETMGPPAPTRATGSQPPAAVTTAGQLQTPGGLPVARPTLRIRGAPMVRPARPDSGNLEPILEPTRSNRATTDLPRASLRETLPPRFAAPVRSSSDTPPVLPRPPGRARMLPRGGPRGDDR